MYKCVDDLSKETLNANVTDFLTSGAMAWYGFISNLTDDCVEKKKYTTTRNTKNVNRLINSKLHRLEHKESQFVK